MLVRELKEMLSLACKLIVKVDMDMRLPCAVESATCNCSAGGRLSALGSRLSAACRQLARLGLMVPLTLLAGGGCLPGKFCSHAACARGLNCMQGLISRLLHCPEWVVRQAFAYICRVSTATGESACGSLILTEAGESLLSLLTM